MLAGLDELAADTASASFGAKSASTPPGAPMCEAVELCESVPLRERVGGDERACARDEPRQARRSGFSAGFGMEGSKDLFNGGGDGRLPITLVVQRALEYLEDIPPIAIDAL